MNATPELSTFDRQAAHASSGEPQTVPQMFWRGVQRRRDTVMMRQKEFGIWREWRWEDVGRTVVDIASGFLGLGVRQGETVAIAANPSVQWVWCDLAVQSLGAVSIGIHAGMRAASIRTLCVASRAVLVVVQDARLLEMLLSMRYALPFLRAIVVIDASGVDAGSDADVLNLEEARALGSARADARARDLERSVGVPDSYAAIICTSGTSDEPKAVLHSNRELMAALKRQQRLLPMSDSDERVLLMPLSIGHERVSMYQCMYIGAMMNFIEGQDTVVENLREVSPTVLSAAPRVWESQRASVLTASRESGGMQQALLNWGFAIGHVLADRRIAGLGLDVWSRLLRRLADLVVLGRVKGYLGLRRARFVVSTGAPIDPVVVRWFIDLGVPMIEAWGSAETAGLVTASSPHSARPGSVGVAAPGDEVRIDAASGEILIRGEAMSAKYLDDGYRTASVRRSDGWVATGDAGALDARGHLSVSSRLWDHVATASGKTMAVSVVEDELRRSPYVADVVVLGRVGAALTAMIMLDRESVERYAQERLLPASGYAALILTPELRQVIQNEIDAVNAKVGDPLAIGHYVLLETQPGIDDEDLTPAMRLRREPVQKKFAEQKFAEQTDAIRR